MPPRLKHNPALLFFIGEELYTWIDYTCPWAGGTVLLFLKFFMLFESNCERYCGIMIMVVFGLLSSMKMGHKG